MNYNAVATFLELVRTRNITKTAELLYVSQSTVSSRLKSLEEELGYQLLIRAKGHREVRLTRQGMAFIPLAERWKNLFEETEGIKQNTLSTVRIAVSESTYYTLITPFLKEFFDRIPKVRVSVQICDSAHIYDLVEGNLVDFGFASYESLRPEISCRCVEEDPLCIIRYAENPGPIQRIRPDQLDPEQEIRFTGGHFDGMNLWREKWFGHNLENTLEVNTCRGIVPFMHRSQRWIISPLAISTLLAEEMPLQIYELEDPPQPWRVYLLKKIKTRADTTEVCRIFEKELLSFLETRKQNVSENSTIGGTQ